MKIGRNGYGLWASLAVLVLATLSLADMPVQMSLDGQWKLSAVGADDVFPATVPGGVHQDMLAAGKIEDPFVGANAEKVKWVGDQTWRYERTFEPAPELLGRKVVMLRCRGLDTVATVTLNGKEVGRADNQFREWLFDVTRVLKPGTNRLVVTFSPWQIHVNEFVQSAKQNGTATPSTGLSNLRKALYGNGWDFAPSLPSIGIDQPISLVGYDVARLEGVAINTDVQLEGPATVTLRPQWSANTTAGLRVRATASLNGEMAAAATGDAALPLTLTIARPQLWWPNGMGERPLYQVTVELIGADGALLDRTTRRIGLRKIELLRPDVAKPEQGPWPVTDRPLRLLVNGRAVFARGASWVPADMFLSRVTPERLRDMLADAAGQNMNFIRTWGGGAYEPDAFFDACDELGLMVWQDFKFACNAYPVRNAAFADNVAQEIKQQVTRLSSHPSVVVWCGNNEVEAIVHRFGVMSQADYDLLFGQIIGGGLRRLMPNAAFVTGSPDEGDEHNWWVWHVGAEFERFRESHGWMTEFGFQSFPVPATVGAFTAPSDRDSVLSPVMKAHQLNGNQRGNEMILDQMDRYFSKPKDFESTLWLSQINQAYGLAIGVEHWRSDWPRSSGAFIWQFNDCWPGASWSIVDYFGRWKAAMYTAKANFSPLMITGVYDGRSHSLPLVICNDDSSSFNAVVAWDVTNAAGDLLMQGKTDVRIPAGTASVRGPILKLDQIMRDAKAWSLLVWVDVLRDGKRVARNLLMTDRPKAMPLVDPKITADVTPAGNGFDVQISSQKPALWAFAQLVNDPDAKWSDNFVHIAASRAAVLHVRPSKAIDLETFRRQLVLRSLYNLTDRGPVSSSDRTRTRPHESLTLGQE